MGSEAQRVHVYNEVDLPGKHLSRTCDRAAAIFQNLRFQTFSAHGGNWTNVEFLTLKHKGGRATWNSQVGVPSKCFLKRVSAFSILQRESRQHFQTRQSILVRLQNGGHQGELRVISMVVSGR